MAKAPVAGEVKTRLMPAFSARDAALIAHAALADTLDAVRACGASRRIVAMAGHPIPFETCTGCEVVPQQGATFNERLAAAWSEAGAPGLQIGMDTPQVTAADLDAALAQLRDGRNDAVLGLAQDGGWWAIGFRTPAPDAFAAVSMSAPDTGEQQLRRLQDLGLRVGLLPTMRDMDTASDVAAITSAHPHLRTAAAARVTTGVPR